MKGFSLACLGACLLLTISIPLAQAAGSAPWMGAPHGAQSAHAGQMRREGDHDRRSRAEIGLGDVVYAPTPDATSETTPDVQPQIIVVTPAEPRIEARPAEAASPGPRIIYVGREPPRPKPGAMPQIIYGDLPSRVSTGPEIIYGDSWR